MATEPRSHYFYASRVLVVVALIAFVLAAFHVQLGGVDMIAAGLAFLAASFLVP
jgi:hypothetical protein